MLGSCFSWGGAALRRNVRSIGFGLVWLDLTLTALFRLVVSPGFVLTDSAWFRLVEAFYLLGRFRLVSLMLHRVSSDVA